MLKITINSQKHGICWLEFSTQADVDAYVQSVTDSQHWGLNQRWEALSEAPSNALDTRIITDVPGIPGIAASYSGSDLGLATVVSIQANSAGVSGNIQLNFDGSSTISATISNWNAANATNLISLISGDGSQIPQKGSLNLSGGTDAIPAITHQEYLLPAEWSYTTEDVTVQYQQDQLIADGKTRQELGAQVIAKVYAINESKNLTPDQFNALMADTTLERIERLLWTGSLATAKLMIQALDNTYFTADEINSILSMLVDY